MSSELESERDRRLRKALRTAATILYGIVLVAFLVFLLTGGSLSGHGWILVMLVASGIAVFAGNPDRIRSDSVRAMVSPPI